jgi:hypothetical protein
MPESGDAASLPMHPSEVSYGVECPAGSLTKRPGTAFAINFGIERLHGLTAATVHSFNGHESDNESEPKEMKVTRRFREGISVDSSSGVFARHPDLAAIGFFNPSHLTQTSTQRGKKT